MSFRFRKSIAKGPFRINFSKNGIGYSVGNKFFRLTKKASGGTRATVSIPGTGISYVKDSKRRKQMKSEQKITSKEVKNEVDGFKKKPKRPFYKKWWFWFIVICVVLSPIFSNNDVEPDTTSESIVNQPANGDEIQDIRDEDVIEEVSPDVEENWDAQQAAPENAKIEEQVPGNTASEEELETVTPDENGSTLEEETVAPIQEIVEEQPAPVKEPASEPEQSIQPGQELTPNSDQEQIKVWIPESGTKYHSDPSCSGMINPTEVTLEEAISMGFEACKRCH